MASTANRVLRAPRWTLAFGIALGLVVASCGGDSASPTATSTSQVAESPTAAGTAPGATTPAATATPAPDLKLLKVLPDTGPINTAFTITGEGLTPNADVDFVWGTVDGQWQMTANAENVQFNTRSYTPSRVSLGKGKVGADGKVTGSFVAPEDYGEVHDVYVAIDGKDVARGGFRIIRQVTLVPESGPIGTPIEIRVTGLGWKPFESILAVRYDNLPTGIITAVTTRGSAVGVIRAAGKSGRHVIDVNHGARSVPYLNNQQSGTKHILDWRVWFTLTDDSQLPPPSVDWPSDDALKDVSSAAPVTTSTGKLSTSMTMQPSSGPILSKTTFNAKQLKPNTEHELFWVTARGNRVSPSGWSLNETSVAKATSGADGTLSAVVEVPDDLGGWHVIKVVAGDTVAGEVPFFIERSLFDEKPIRVKAGETFELHLKGIGWTELDNGIALTYDNAYMGFACGFNSNGDVTVPLVATGEPGIHLIDLYPMIYQGHGEPPWGYQQAILTYREDAPGLQLGYKLPAFRLAIEVTE